MNHNVGDKVHCDESEGVVLERIASGRKQSDDYRVEWSNGSVTVEWGSDLTPR